MCRETGIVQGVYTEKEGSIWNGMHEQAGSKRDGKRKVARNSMEKISILLCIEGFLVYACRICRIGANQWLSKN